MQNNFSENSVMNKLFIFFTSAELHKVDKYNMQDPKNPFSLSTILFKSQHVHKSILHLHAQFNFYYRY